MPKRMAPRLMANERVTGAMLLALVFTRVKISVLYIFVGVQMTWVLRPFLGWEDIPVTFFRQEKWVNAYVELFKTFYWYLTQ